MSELTGGPAYPPMPNLPFHRWMPTMHFLRGYMRGVGIDYAIFGSGVMALHDIRHDIGDLDVAVSQVAWNQLRTMISFETVTPDPAHPPFLTMEAKGLLPINVFYDWRADEPLIDVKEMLREAELVMGFSAIPLTLLLKHKEMALAYYREQHNDDVIGTRYEKHLHDAAAIRAHLRLHPMRADGGVLCKRCGDPYRAHRAITVPETASLVVHELCDGSCVKL